MNNNLLPLLVVIPLAGAFLTAFLGTTLKENIHKKLLDLLVNLSSLGGLTIAVLIATTVFNSRTILTYNLGGWMWPVGILWRVDALSIIFLVTVNFLGFMATLFSVGYMEKYTDKWKYYSLFLLLIAGMNTVSITGDLFNLYVFLELTTIASYALVAFGCEADELEASFKYLVLGSISSLFILLAIALLYGYTSSLNMVDISRFLLNNRMPQSLLTLITTLFFVGFSLKAAIVPFHAWLPDAHPSAPAPISAMLSGIIIKVLGIYPIVRIFFNIITPPAQFFKIFLYLGALSMLVGVLLAVYQWDFKRLLAYHSISQIGYVVVGIALATPLGVAAGLFHLINHAVFKSLLFFNSGAVEYATGTRDLHQMGGLQNSLPATSGSCLVASMSIAGIPPFNGFWSKLLIILAAIQSGHYLIALIAVIVSIITLASFLKVQKYAFRGEKKFGRYHLPVGMNLTMIILALACLGFSLIMIPKFYTIILDAAQQVVVAGPAVFSNL